MSNELQALHPTGQALYAQILDSTGSIWNTSGTPTFESYSTANIADYDIALTEQGTASQIYLGDMPSLSAGLYHVLIRERAGGSPAESDPIIGNGLYHWDGSALVPVGSLTTTEENAVADALLDRTNGVETSYTLRQALRLVLSACVAKLSGAETTSVTIRDIGDSKNRITATVDEDGNRTAVSYDVS